MTVSMRLRFMLPLAGVLALSVPFSAAAAEQDCAAILKKLTFGTAEFASAQAEGPESCHYQTLLLVPVKGTPTRLGAAADELTLTTPDWTVIDKATIPARFRIVIHGGRNLFVSGRKALDFMMAKAAPRFDLAVDYAVDPATAIATVKVDLAGKRLGSLQLEEKFRQIDPAILATAMPSALTSIQIKQIKLHFENVSLVQGYIWNALATWAWTGDDAEQKFNQTLSQAKIAIATLAPRFGADPATVAAMTRILADFPDIEKPIDANVEFQDPTALGAIAAALTETIPPETIRMTTLKVGYGP